MPFYLGEGPANPPLMEHHVYFWLKQGRNNPSDRSKFEAGMSKLMGSENLESGCWGKPATTKERPVTDHSWNYALSFKFTTLEEHDAYQSDDPHHMAFVEDFKDWWERVLVMDLE